MLGRVRISTISEKQFCLISDGSDQKGIPDFWLHLLEGRAFLPDPIQVLLHFFTLAFILIRNLDSLNVNIYHFFRVTQYNCYDNTSALRRNISTYKTNAC